MLLLFMDQKVWYLKNVRLFRDMPDAFAEALHRATIMQHYQGGQMISTPQEMREKIYIVKEGQVNIYEVSPEGKKLVLDVLGQGDLFGDISFSETISPPAHFAETTKETYLCIASKSEFLLLLKMWPDIALRLMQEVGMRLQNAEQRIRDFAFHNVLIKIINALIRHAKKHGKETEQYFIVTDRLTHEDIAALVGISRETVTRALQTLKEKKCVMMNTEGIHVDKQKIPEPL